MLITNTSFSYIKLSDSSDTNIYVFTQVLSMIRDPTGDSSLSDEDWSAPLPAEILTDPPIHCW